MLCANEEEDFKDEDFDYSNDDFKDEDFDYSNDDEVLKLTLAVILPMRPDMQVKKDSVGCKRLTVCIPKKF